MAILSLLWGLFLVLRKENPEFRHLQHERYHLGPSVSRVLETIFADEGTSQVTVMRG